MRGADQPHQAGGRSPARIVDLAITTGTAELADLASLALQLAPRPDLAATLARQQVTQYRAGARGGELDTASHLAGQPVVRLAHLRRQKEALAASEEAVTVRGSWPPDG